MKLDYSFEREDYIKFLKMTNNKMNLVCIAFFTLVYFVAIFDLIKGNLALILVFYFISAAILFSILKMISTVFVNLIVKRNDKLLEYAYGTYHISIDKTAIKEEIKDKKFEIKFCAIAHIKNSKNVFVVYPKDSGIMYIFMKSGFKTEKKYQECKETILNYFEEAKQGSIEVEPLSKTEENKAKEVVKKEKASGKENISKMKEKKQSEKKDIPKKGKTTKETTKEKKTQTKKKETAKETKKK